jgi:hypothetical protein
MSSTRKLTAKKWQKAELWQVGLWDNKYHLCGLRFLWVLVGTKHVQLAAPVCETKMRMSRKEWNAMYDKERYHTEEDKEIYRAKRKKIWDDAQQMRKEVEAGTYKKPKRKYRRRKGV